MRYILTMVMTCVCIATSVQALQFTPADKSLIDNPTVAFTGQLEGGAGKVIINDKDIKTDPSGSFSGFLYLKNYGKYHVAIEAQENGKISKKDIRILYMPSATALSQRALLSLNIFPGRSAGDMVSYEDVAALLMAIEKYPAAVSRKDANDLAYKSGYIGEVGRPGREISRAEFAQALVTFENIPVDSAVQSPYTDVKLNAPLNGAIAAAFKAGLLKQLSDSDRDVFSPARGVSLKELLACVEQTEKGRRVISQLLNFDDFALAQEPTISQQKRITLRVDSIDINQLVKIFKEETGINIVHGNLTGKVSVNLKDVEPVTALNSILGEAGYSLQSKEGTYYIVSGKSAKKTIKAFTINYADIDLLAGEVVKLVPSLEGQILIGKSSNSLIIDANHPDIDKITEIIERLDAPPKQVFVEAEILDLAVNDSEKFGFNYAGGTNANLQTSEYNQNNETLDKNSRGLFVKVVSDGVQGYLQLLKQGNADYDLLSSPRLMVLNGREGIISTGRKLGYKVEDTINTSGGSTKVTKIEFLDIGTKLRLIPRIGDDGLMVMEIYPEVSDGEIDSNGIPQERRTLASSQVLVRDGQAIVIGGLNYDKIEKTKMSIPILGSLPLLGFLFRSEETKVSKRDVVVILTPHIVNYLSLTGGTSASEKEHEKHEEYRKMLQEQN